MSTSTKQDVYRKKLHAKIDSMKAKLDRLGARTREKAADGQLALLDKIDALSARCSEAGRQLEELGSAGAERWDEAKHRLEELHEELDLAWGAVKADVEERTKRDEAKQA